MKTRVLVVDDSPTIRKVVSSILERHGYDAVAASDGQRALDILALEENKFDLVLVDFVMPRMNGFQFCRALREREEHSGIPVVLMSARTDKIRDQFVDRTGAVDAITKPFDAQALVAVIEHAMRRPRAGRAIPAASVSGDELDSEMHGGPTTSTTTSDAGERVVAAMTAFARRIAETLAPALSMLPASALVAPLDAEAIASALVAPGSIDALRDLLAFASSADALDLGAKGKVVLSGDIAAMPVGAVLQLLQVEQRTGFLVATNAKSEVTLALRAGLIDFVASENAGDEFRLGRFFVEQGLVTPEQLADVLKQQVEKGSLADPAEHVRLGDALLRSGCLTEQNLRDALARQASELTYEVLRWQGGRFEFRNRTESVSRIAPESAKLGLPVAHVVMEGFRRVDEWRLIESQIDNFDTVLQPDRVAISALDAEATTAPTKGELAMLALVDGERTVRELIAASHMSSFDASKILYQLLEARLVRRRVV
jgi:DNA-binding response OmpR family regulator